MEIELTEVELARLKVSRELAKAQEWSADAEKAFNVAEAHRSKMWAYQRWLKCSLDTLNSANSADPLEKALSAFKSNIGDELIRLAELKMSFGLGPKDQYESAHMDAALSKNIGQVNTLAKRGIPIPDFS